MRKRELLNHPIIAQRYFFPRRDRVAKPRVIECRGERLACAYRETAPEAPTLVHFHGNGEVAADYLDGFPDLIGAMGCNCLLVEYRGYGGSSGEPLLGEMLEDAPALIEALDVPAEKIILFGRSVGSLFALKAAGRYPTVAGMILESAIADLLERLLLRLEPAEIGATPAELAEAVRDSLDIPAVMRNFHRPLLVMHTRNDELVAADHAERLAAWSGGPVRLQIFPRGGHNDIMFVNGEEYFGLVRQFIAGLR